MGFAFKGIRTQQAMGGKMNKVLIAVDDTKASKAVISSFQNLVQKPESAILLYAERLEGRSLMIDMLGDAEMSTLKETLQGTEHKDKLDEKAERILDYYKRELENGSTVRVKTVIRAGHPAEEILKVANEEGVELIILGGSERRGLGRLIAGNVDREVGKNAKVPVLLAKRANICEEPYTWRDALAAISVTTAVVFGLFLLGIIFEGKKFLH
jgi:nucleotide-binding universal stress UspA family protein